MLRDVVLLAARADDLELVETVLQTLPPRSRGQVFLESRAGAAPRELRAPGRVCVTWLDADRGQSSVRAAEDRLIPAGCAVNAKEWLDRRLARVGLRRCSGRARPWPARYNKGGANVH